MLADVPPTAAVVVTVTGLKPGGDLQLAIFDAAEAWKRRAPPVQTRTVAVPDGVAEVRIAGLPPGRYGIMAFHDRNRDSRLNTLPIGLPTEPYGFSNNARGTFGPPSWSKAAFDVRGTVRQAITLR